MAKRKYPAPRFLVEPILGTAREAAKLGWGETGVSNRAQRAFNQQPTAVQKAVEKQLKKEAARLRRAR